MLGQNRQEMGAPLRFPVLDGDILGLKAWQSQFGILCALHAAMCLVIKVAGSAEFKKQPHLAAHFLPQLVGFGALAWLGVTGWILNPPPPGLNQVGGYFAGAPARATHTRAHTTHHDSTRQPTHATCPSRHTPRPPLPHTHTLSVAPPRTAHAHRFTGGENISSVMLAFQLYELAACVPCPRLRGLKYEMVVHHCITLLLAVLAYTYGAYHYFCPVFMGISEISSMPLALVDLFKMFPAAKALWPGLNELARNVFAATFLPIRGMYWPYCSLLFWKASLAADLGGTPGFVILTFQAANIVMNVLQQYWASLIVSAVYQKLTGDKKHKEA